MVLLGVVSLVASTLFRRRTARPRERVDIYAEDGSMVSVADRSPEADRMLALAHDLIHSVQ